MQKEALTTVPIGEGGLGLSYEKRTGLALLGESVKVSQRRLDNGTIRTTALFDAQNGIRVAEILQAATNDPNGSVNAEGIIDDWALVRKKTDGGFYEKLHRLHTKGFKGTKPQAFAPFSNAFSRFLSQEAEPFLRAIENPRVNLQTFIPGALFVDGESYYNLDWWKHHKIDQHGLFKTMLDIDRERVCQTFGITDEDVEAIRERLQRYDIDERSLTVPIEEIIVSSRFIDPSLAVDSNARLLEYDFDRTDDVEFDKRLTDDRNKCDEKLHEALLTYLKNLPEDVQMAHLKRYNQYYQLQTLLIDMHERMYYSRHWDVEALMRLYQVQLEVEGSVATISDATQEITVEVGEADENGVMPVRSVRRVTKKPYAQGAIVPVLMWDTITNGDGSVERKLVSVDTTREEAEALVGRLRKTKWLRGEHVSPILGRAIAAALVPNVHGSIRSEMYGQRIEAVQVGVLFEDEFAEHHLKGLDPLLEKLESASK